MHLYTPSSWLEGETPSVWKKRKVEETCEILKPVQIDRQIVKMLDLITRLVQGQMLKPGQEVQLVVKLAQEWALHYPKYEIRAGSFS